MRLNIYITISHLFEIIMIIMLACKGFMAKYGARQVVGTIRNHIRRPISKMIIAGKGEINYNVKQI